MLDGVVPAAMLPVGSCPLEEGAVKAAAAAVELVAVVPAGDVGDPAGGCSGTFPAHTTATVLAAAALMAMLMGRVSRKKTDSSTWYPGKQTRGSSATPVRSIAD
jgi:hypothetical protein